MEKRWKTPSRGKYNWDEMCTRIRKFVEEDSNYDYLIAVGTDSQQHGKDKLVVTSIGVHRVDKDNHDRGHGGQYYYTAETLSYIKTLRQQIMYEASLTYKYKEELKECLKDLLEDHGMHIIPHSDIGEDGETKQFIKEIRGMFSGFGPEEDVRIKPYSWAASSLANKHTK
jgi:predicted RNase H-related nuclease YkuK (DUF458 family)